MRKISVLKWYTIENLIKNADLFLTIISIYVLYYALPFLNVLLQFILEDVGYNIVVPI